jgi:hypothetical protein
VCLEIRRRGTLSARTRAWEASTSARLERRACYLRNVVNTVDGWRSRSARTTHYLLALPGQSLHSLGGSNEPHASRLFAHLRADRHAAYTRCLCGPYVPASSSRAAPLATDWFTTAETHQLISLRHLGPRETVSSV